MLKEINIPKYFWVDVVSISCYVMNHVLIRFILKKKHYNLLKGIKSNIFTYMFLYANALYLKTRRKKLQKFDAKVDKGVFLKYPTSSKAFSVFNKRTVTIE